MATEKSPLNINKLIKNIVTLISVALVVFILWYFKSVTIYILSGVILSLVARPLYLQLEKIKMGKFKIPGAINALFSIFLVMGILGGITALLFPIVLKEASKVSKIDPEKLLTQLEKPINKTVAELEMLGIIHFNDSLQTDTTPQKMIERVIIYKIPADSLTATNIKPDTVLNTISVFPVVSKDSTHGIAHRKELESMLKHFWTTNVSLKSITKLFGSVFGIAGNIIATIASAIFLAFFFLRDKSLFKNMVIALVPEKYEKQAVSIMEDSRKLLSRYFIGLVLELILVMICTTIGLLIVGIKFELAVTIGFFCGFFNIVPYVGPLIGGAIGLLLATTNYLEADAYATIFPLIVKMSIVFAIVQVLDNNIFQTVIFSNSVNAHPIEIFLVIVMAGHMSGVMGMVFAVPVYTFLRIIARQFFSQFKVVRSLTQNM